MDKYARTLLVIITEAALEKRLVADGLRLGAQGYTVHDVRGGSRLSVRESLWEADRSIEMKVIASPEVADAMAHHVLATYAPHYSLTLYLSGVDVLRPDKF
jgi:nitrogen regulatory protein P-II 2